ncbi:helix-turn-helix domain-containing protein [Frankia sp. CiP1_Cm_nod1]|uniref:helix-turn-helix domain-containing protein n=1 Tax=Frankia sp. CiP1_Cm_nod1 TaxID=2897160 RepID=UPI002023F6DD
MTSRNRELPAAPAGLWDRPEMVHALEQRDMAAVLKIFQKWTGATQGQIATACGTPQSHISEIRNGKRQVMTLAVFERFASGLNIPRARLGLESDKTSPDAPPATTTAETLPTRRTVSLAIPAAVGLDMAPDTLVTAAARQSAAILERLGAATVDPLVLEQLADDVARLSLDYIAGPPEAVLADTIDTRTRVLALLDQARRPAQIHDLYLIAGQLSGILAYGAIDLGKPGPAMTHARTALMCADLAGHTDLAVWARGTQSLIARFANRHREALQYIHAGMALRPTGAGLARIVSGEAQCLAHLGDIAGTRAALAAAADASDHDTPPSDIETGLFTFPRAMQYYYAGGSLIWLPDNTGAADAEQAITTAITLFTTGPADQRFVADEILAHVYLATARLLRGNIDGVTDALRPVLTIPPQQRVSWHRRRLDRIAALLDAPRYRTSTTAADLRHEIVAF